jgi:hypothetical protein
MAFTKEQLIELRAMFADNTTTMNVLVPSTDYYARRGDFEEDSITFIDARKLDESIHLKIMAATDD